MAASRLGKHSTIFARIDGLIKSGVIKYDDRPVWFNVYKAFSPATPPKYNRPPPQKEHIVNILYPEDLIRAKFDALYRRNLDETIDLTNHAKPTICQQFVDKYFELKKTNTIKDADLFSETVKYFKSKGIKLITEEENKEATKLKKMAGNLFTDKRHYRADSATEVFGHHVQTFSRESYDDLVDDD